MPKKDYYDDPAAPVANSLIVAVAVAVRSEGRLLLIKRSDNGLWALPGGAQDIGESTRDAATREVREETGIEIEVNGISGIYSDPRHVIAYDDGEVRQEFSIVFHAAPVGGRLRGSSESTCAEWVDIASVAGLEVHRSMRLRIEHALREHQRPYLG